jgi:fused signal recognition particle receptor
MVFWKRKRDPQPTPPPVPEDLPTSPLREANFLEQLPSTIPEQSETIAPQRGDAPNVAKPAGKSWWRRILTKTNELLRTDILDLWKEGGRLVDDKFVNDLYAILVRTDMGNAMATKIKESIYKQYKGRKIEMSEALDVIRENISSSLRNTGAVLRFAESGPTVILVVGVNGSGKTTSIAKLAYRLTQAKNRVLLGAGDTFRAAAVEQLKIWSERIGCEIVQGEPGSDPASVAYRAIQKAVAEDFDICILDTAGRLQTQTNLMQELEKIKRVLAKQNPGAPHEVLLVLDATAGQNAISQAKGFSQAAGCTGIILAKLDGSAKGGVVVPIAEQFQLPVKFVGLGEKLEDLAEFDPDSFANALFN